MSGPHWVCPCSRRVCFCGLHCSGSRFLCRGTKAGPGWRALPRYKPLRFRFLGTPQRRRLSWACVFCLSQVQAAQVTRCLSSTHSAGGAVHLITSPRPSCSGVPSISFSRSGISGVPSISFGELIFGCDPPSGYQSSRISGRLG